MRARDNPFGTARIHEVRYQLSGISWNDLLSRLERMNYSGAIVGPEGSGKTTLLEDLVPRLRAQGLEVISLGLTRERTFFSSAELAELGSCVTAHHVVLLDGAEQLGRWQWFRFRRRVRGARGLIITSHRAGLLPTILQCSTTAELLEDIVTRLLAGVGWPGPAQIDRLYQRHRGNVREALRELYDLYAEGALR